jgi:polyisoprenoid-binding protein YceI
VLAATVLMLGAWPAGAAVELAVDPSQSYIAVRVDKGGLLSFAGGHRHGLLVNEWTARLCWEEKNPAASAARVVIRTGSLVIDTPEARAKAGIEERGPGAEDVKELQGKVLSPRFLSAESHPEITFVSTTVRPQGAGVLHLAGPVTIRGQTRSVSAPARFEQRADNSLFFTADLRVKQSDFGIKPESVGGVVNVKDEVEIRLRFLTRPTERACPAAP